MKAMKFVTVVKKTSLVFENQRALFTNSTNFTTFMSSV